MFDSRRYKLLLVHVVGLLSVSGDPKYVCPGNSIPVFRNVDFDRCNSLVALNMIGDRNILIATWSYQNCILNETFLKGFDNRVLLDQNGTITIHNFRTFDQGIYVVFSKKDTLPSVQEVEIKVMVIPSKDCKPMITRIGDKLFASLKPDDCGYPLPAPYWKGYDGISDTDEPFLKKSPGSETRTYIACIKSPSLECTKGLNHLDYCTSFVIEGNHKTTMETLTTVVTSSGDKVHTVLLILLTLIATFAFALVLFVFLRRRKRKSKQRNIRFLNVHPPGENHTEKDPETHALHTEYKSAIDSTKMLAQVVTE